MVLKNSCTGAEDLIIKNNLKMLGYDPKGIDCIFADYTRPYREF